jgi:hypothetical protein
MFMLAAPHDRIAQLHRARCEGAPLDVVLLAVDLSQLPELAMAAIVLLAASTSTSSGSCTKRALR